MSAILPTLTIESPSHLARHFTPYQVNWILSDDMLHAENKQAFALAEKSVRVGWTYADGMKNVRKRLRYPKRDYLFATRDHGSAIEYMHTTYTLCEVYNYTRDVVSHGEELLKIPRLDKEGRPTGFTEEMKVGMIKFENGSRIIAFSSNPQAMAVYGGDVGLDEFAKHNNAQLLWETAQGRVTWGFDIAIWSAHNGDDTLFYTFAQEARAGLPPWNLYYRVTMPDAIELGLVNLINKVRHTNLTPEQFLADCRARSHQEEIFQQAYMCNPAPAAAGLVDWPTLERCRLDYQIARAHLENADVVQLFGDLLPSRAQQREAAIQSWLRRTFQSLLASHHSHLLGFDVAASGQGDLAAF